MKRTQIPAIVGLLVLYAVVAIVGIGWGLPSTETDKLLFGGGTVWSGERIARLSGGSDRFSDTRGADVDADPVVFAGDQPVDLTATEADVAAIYRRYRLFTHQPDEMITMMALASMRPRELHFDPKLYQYGGLFIYPVGAMIGLGGRVGLIEVTSDLVYYLDHPDEFGKFYLAARVYVALWGALGVVLICAIASRLGGFKAGVIAALLFTLMPVVVCMSHEAKPHLPGAVLMLAAVWWAMRYVEGDRRRDWAGMCLACGAAFGTVLSSLPIFVLIPLAEWMRRASSFAGDSPSERAADLGPRDPSTGDAGIRPSWRRILGGAGIGLAVYLATNPYVPINVFVNREVLRSNLSNSTAMYEIGRLGEGLVRVLELTVEGARLPVLLIGVAGLAVAFRRRRWDMLPLAVPAGLVFVQFVLLGAGKPAEYGRFGVFPDTALAIAAACVLAGRRRPKLRAVELIPAALVVLTTGYFGWGYLYNFHKDAGPENTRAQFGLLWDGLSSRSEDSRPIVSVLADPAPYCLPPMDFARTKVLRYPSLEAYLADPQGVLVIPADTNATKERDMTGSPLGGGVGKAPYSPMSWANKPMVLRVLEEATGGKE